MTLRKFAGLGALSSLFFPGLAMAQEATLVVVRQRAPQFLYQRPRAFHHRLPRQAGGLCISCRVAQAARDAGASVIRLGGELISACRIYDRIDVFFHVPPDIFQWLARSSDRAILTMPLRIIRCVVATGSAAPVTVAAIRTTVPAMVIAVRPPVPAAVGATRAGMRPVGRDRRRLGGSKGSNSAANMA